MSKPVLSDDIIKALTSYTVNMEVPVTFVLQTGEYAKREELVEFLSAIASVSDKLLLDERDCDSVLRSPVSFYLEVNGQSTGISFSGIPGGHEFNSLVLAILRSSGAALKLDDGIQAMVAAIQEPLHFEVFVSLSCHNCPDVVQALDQFALLNDNISAEMIDGGLYPELIEQRDIQGVPSVYLNGELFANGKVDTAKMIDKLQTLYP